MRAEHAGYARLGHGVVHRRGVTFDKARRLWLVEDEIAGEGEHAIAARFHFDAGLEVEARRVKDADLDLNIAVAWDKMTRKPDCGSRLFVCALDLQPPPALEQQFTSKHYGSKSALESRMLVSNAELAWQVALGDCAGCGRRKHCGTNEGCPGSSVQFPKSSRVL